MKTLNCFYWRSNNRLPSYKPWISFLVLICVVLGAVNVVQATPPSLMVVFVNQDELAAVTKAHFGEVMSSSVQKLMIPSPRPFLRNPYRSAFEALDRPHSIIKLFQYLWNTGVRHKESHQFDDFLSEINKRPIVRSVISSPGYSGCLLVLFSREEDKGKQYLVIQNSAHQFKGCRPTYNARYKTVSRVVLNQ